MPGMDGFDTARMIRLRERSAHSDHLSDRVSTKWNLRSADPFLCWSFRLKWSTDRNSLRSSRETDDETGHEQHQKDEENDLRYRKGAGGDAAEPENARDDGDHKKYHSVIKHY
jgi:hypothetical protein